MLIGMKQASFFSSHVDAVESNEPNVNLDQGLSKGPRVEVFFFTLHLTFGMKIKKSETVSK